MTHPTGIEPNIKIVHQDEKPALKDTPLIFGGTNEKRAEVEKNA